MNLTQSEKDLLRKLVGMTERKEISEEFHVSIVQSGARVFVSGVDTVIPEITKGKLASLHKAELVDSVEKPEWFFSVRIKHEGYEAVKRNFRGKTDLAWLTFIVAVATLAATVFAFLYAEYLK